MFSLQTSFDYATQGVCCSEVEIDCLTAEIQIRRSDIHMDVGSSLNPAIDIGQIEGGFVMALGYLLTEEVLFGSAEGNNVPAHPSDPRSRFAANQIQLNIGTWNYKPPSAYDIPEQLNVSLLGLHPNPSPASVMKSKGIAEPPMALACAVVLAAKEAIYDVRRRLHGLENYVDIDLPLTTERIQRACLADSRSALSLT